MALPHTQPVAPTPGAATLASVQASLQRHASAQAHSDDGVPLGRWLDQYQGVKARTFHPTPVELFGVPSIAGGRVFTSTTIDSMLVESEFESHTLPLMRQLIFACRNLRLRLVPLVAIYRFQQWVCSLEHRGAPVHSAASAGGGVAAIDVEDTPCLHHVHTYADVADALLREWNALPLGLYRRSFCGTVRAAAYLHRSVHPTCSRCGLHPPMLTGAESSRARRAWVCASVSGRPARARA